MRRAFTSMLMGVALVAAAAWSAPVVGAQQAPEGPPGAPRLTLLDQPIVVAPNGRFPVFVAIDDAPTATEIAVYIYDRVEPGELVGVEPEEDPEATFEVVPLTTEDPAGRRTSGFSIALHTDDQPNPDPAWGHQIDEPGVYPVRVRLRDGDGNVLAVLMTALVRLPDAGQQVAATGAALVVEIHRPPPADPEERAATDDVDPVLLDELEPVLTALATRPSLPAAFSVTPETATRIAGDEAGTEELASLRAAVDPAGRTVIDAPYVNVDPASLVSAGLASELTTQRELGRQTLTDLLEPPAAGTWHLSTHLDESAVAELRSRGIFRTLVPEDALEAGAGVLEPADVDAGGVSMRAVAVSEVYALGAGAEGDPVLAAHRLLARLAAAATDRSDGASVVVDLDPGRVEADTLRIVFDAMVLGSPFLRASDLDAVLNATPSTTAVLAPPELPSLGSYPVEVRSARTDLASYGSMVAGRADLLRPYERTLAISAAADLDLAERRRDATSVSADLEVPFSAISIPATDKVTLGARDARFPLPIESDLDYPVQVVIELEASDRLAFPNNRIEATLDSEREVVQIRVRTRATGDTPVRVTIRTPDDGQILTEGRYVIRSTAVSGVGVVLTVGAAAFLALWWGRHWFRSRRSGGQGLEV